MATADTKKPGNKKVVTEKDSEKGQALQSDKNVWFHSLLTDFDVALFISGKHFRLYEKMGAHLLNLNDVPGTYFAVWAPNAKQVNVIGNFNIWDNTSHKLFNRWDASGIWEGFIPYVGKGEVYKYAIVGFDGVQIEKGDPYAIKWEHPPKNASVVWDMDYVWKDKSWLNKRAKLNALDQPMSVYELHLGSWKRDPSEPERVLTYKEIATTLVPYVVEMGFTHVELMPIMEYPYFPSWGYQITGYFAASSRHGTPQELMYLIDELHK
ncbi:MAG: 1,4-alpha-glucan branching enzyme, partial [Pedobacter sp.]|nr:1,4-alpha-glucan branching enzyme [Pedobacter sp.]